MEPEPDVVDESAEAPAHLLMLAGLAFVLGASVGLLCALFRVGLVWAADGRTNLIARAHAWGVSGFVLLVASATAATWLAAWMVRRVSPEAKGSGIPHVEAVLREEQPPAPLILVPVKFVGGLLSIGAGLALGREGPCVQMGACLAHPLGRLGRRNAVDRAVLTAASAGAGLATAFNAPIAGGVFVLEELARRFDPRLTIATLGASASAIAVARLVLGDAPEFKVGPVQYAEFATLPYYLALGVVLGLLGMAYGRGIFAALALAARCERWPELPAALVGAGVGVTAWFAPDLLGSGEVITQHLLIRPATVTAVFLAFLFRFVLGAVSYAANTPGGLFAPMLLVGAQAGLLFGMLTGALPGGSDDPTAFAIVGMAALFTAVVRAPVTGIVLIIEMTDGFGLLLPMLLCCFAAMTVPTMLGMEPIYDDLRRAANRPQDAET